MLASFEISPHLPWGTGEVVAGIGACAAGVALVGFDFFVGLALGLGAGHEDAVESEANQAAG